MALSAPPTQENDAEQLQEHGQQVDEAERLRVSDRRADEAPDVRARAPADEVARRATALV